MKMKFTIEQIAIAPRDPVKAKELLKALGAEQWAEDHVVAVGTVFGKPVQNGADLSFNYDLGAAKEFEVLNYTTGDNWLAHQSDQEETNCVSHLGMHCTAEELTRWRAFFSDRGIRVAQEVLTRSHTNPVIDGKRTYNYVIFDTKFILGVDLKFIVRMDVA